MIVTKQYKSCIFFIIFFSALVAAWQFAVDAGTIPSFILPSPARIFSTFIRDRNLIFSNMFITLGTTLLGLIIALLVAIALAVIMDGYAFLRRMIYPIILIFQIVPTLIFAPMLVLWFGYGMKTQLLMVILMCFFPMLIALLRGFQSVSQSHILLLQSMGARFFHILYWIKFPNAAFSLWSSMRMVVTYAVTASVISEWVGSLKGLGVMIIASQKSFAIERVLVVIVVIVIMSLMLYACVVITERICMPWRKYR